jgi:gluconolactonase
MTRLKIVRMFTGLLALCASMAWAQAPQPAPRPFSIERLDPALDALIAPGTLPQVLADDFGLSEGPVWVPQGKGYLAFSDLTANVIYRWTPDGGVSVLLEKAGYSGEDLTNAGTQVSRGRVAVLMIGPNGETVDRQGRLIYCASPDGTVVRLERDGSRTILADKFDGKRFNGPNDVVSKSDGAIIFTDSDFGLRGSKNSPLKQLQFNGVYLVRADRQAKLLIKDADLGGFTNGIALSPDEKYLYLSSGFKKMMRYELRPDDTLGAGTVFFEGGTGIADGMKADLKGNLYSTGGAGPGEIRITSPDGRHLGTIHMPIPAGEPRRQICATNLAFGESDGKSLFITACEALYRIRVKTPGIHTESK